MYYVYALVSEITGKIYIGQTNNLDKRLMEHNDTNNTNTFYTKRNKGPWRIFYKETVDTRTEAMKMEKSLKSQKGREFLHSLLN
ncbi:GIY-YIG nuclease family protein [candidate division WOR-3 bacterium]|nr:GIY-YIG nuclease family protein [candidate division WOR-3 bacterium]